jgi:apolipoprotein D and lipocalin family protein
MNALMKHLLLAPLVIPMLSACQSVRPPITTASSVDLPRFMGDWYGIASIPTFIEKHAYGAVESYRLDSDGTIDTTFTFNKGSFEGPKKRYNPRGFVLDKRSNAVWGMRFVWPIKADYRIVYVSSDYGQTIIGRQARDYVWIMARSPTISEADYQKLLEFVKREGYDPSLVRKVPQRPEGHDDSRAQ